MAILVEEDSLIENEGDNNEESHSNPEVASQGETIDEELSVGRKFKAFMRQYSPVVSALSSPRVQNFQGIFRRGDRDFDLGRELKDIPEDLWSSYQWCKSREDIEAQSEHLRLEAADREIVRRAGVGESLIYSIPSVLDPVNVAVAGATVAALPASVPAGVLGGAVGVTTGYIGGKVRQSSQDLLRDDEVIAETVAGVVIASAFSAAGKALANSKIIEHLKDRIATQWSDISFSFREKVQYTPRSDGNVSKYKISDMPAWFIRIYDKTPVGRCATSDFEVLNKAGEMFFRTDYITEYTKSGLDRAPSVEALIEAQKGKLLFLESDFVETNNRYLKSEYAKKYNLDFRGAVREALLSGRSHESVEVNKATKELRGYLNELFKEAHDLGITDYGSSQGPMKMDFPYLTEREAQLTVKELKTRVSQGIIEREDLFYIPRIWDIEKVLNYRPVELRQLLEMSAIKQGKSKTFAESQYNHIIGASAGERWSIPELNKSPTKAERYNKDRTVLVDDRLLTPWLVNDPLAIVRAVHRKLVPAISTKKTLRAYGYEDMGDVFKALDREYAERLKVMPEGTASKLHVQYKESAQLLKDLPLLVEGIYGKDSLIKNPRVGSVLYALRNFNFARLLGGMTLSSLNDPQMLVNTWGVKPVLKSYLREFGHSLGLSQSPPSKIIKEELQRMGVAIELATLDTANRLDSAGLHPSRYLLNGGRLLGRAVEASDWLARQTSKWSGIAWWNDFNKRVNGALYCDRLLEACIVGEKAFLSQMRVPLGIAKRISGQFERFGEIYEGFRIPNSQLWEDKEAQSVFAASVVTNSNNTVIIPGTGEVPRWFKQLPGKALVAYRSYGFAVTNNLLAKWANGRREHMVSAILSGTALTALSVYLKSLDYGDPYRHLDDPEFYKQVAERSDLSGYIMDTVKTIDNFYTSSKKEGVGGFLKALNREVPLLGLISNMAYIPHYTSRRSERPISEHELRNTIGMLPFTTLPLVRFTVNSLARGYAEETGGKLMKTREDRYWENRE
jgi:hypothetical protein